MAWLNQKLRQRLLGAFVLTALAVIFLPMLLNRSQDDPPQVQVEVPPMPTMPALPEIQPESVVVAEPPLIIDDESDVEARQQPQPQEGFDDAPVAQTQTIDAKATIAVAPATRDAEQPDKMSETPQPKVITQPPAKPVAQPSRTSPPPASRLDRANLPISWSVQLASLRNRSNAEKLRDDLRRKGYNAYIRSADGMSKVLVGPLIDRNAANSLRNELENQQRLKGFVVRFQP